MGTTLKVIFGGTKREIQPYWLPVIVELQPHTGDSVLKFAIEDVENDLTDDPQLYVAVFKIPNLKEGHYAVTILDSHLGHQIAHDPDLPVRGTEVAYTVLKQDVDIISPVFQPNTFAMDLVVDAPHRLQKSCPYLPIVVYLKDIDPGEIKIKSIEIFTYTSPHNREDRLLPAGALHRVLDKDGAKVEKNGEPALLRIPEGEDHETVVSDPWFRIILVKRDAFDVLHGKHLAYESTDYLQYRVKVRYKRFFHDSKRFVLRTIVSDADLPRAADWYYGDSHYHSDFTDNPYEYGGPLSMTAEVARAAGLSWITVTDHSYGLSRPRTPEEENEGNRWQTYKKAIRHTNERYDDVLLVGAEEITVKKPIAGLHLLSFNNPFVEDRHFAGFGSLNMREALDEISRSFANNGGMIYAAHPASKGYTWEEADYEVAADPRYDNLFMGVQIFNEKIHYAGTTRSSMDRDTVNPFELLDENNRRRPWSAELRKGIKDHWVERFLLPSLRDCRRNGDLRKYFVLAGSDAHMDFNYAFRPHPAFLVHYLNDNAFGKVRTLAYLPNNDGSALTEHNLYEALRSGKTLLTDGPVALFTLRPAGGGRIYRFGETVKLASGADLELALEWQSTAEFGPIERVNLYLGTDHGEEDITGRIPLPELGNAANGLEGSAGHIFSNWTGSPCYLRLEAASRADPQTGEGLFRCITNPIWIITE